MDKVPAKQRGMDANPTTWAAAGLSVFPANDCSDCNEWTSFIPVFPSFSLLKTACLLLSHLGAVFPPVPQNTPFHFPLNAG